jgi:hypothetical protein
MGAQQRQKRAMTSGATTRRGKRPTSTGGASVTATPDVATAQLCFSTWCALGAQRAKARYRRAVRAAGCTGGPLTRAATRAWIATAVLRLGLEEVARFEATLQPLIGPQRILLASPDAWEIFVERPTAGGMPATPPGLSTGGGVHTRSRYACCSAPVASLDAAVAATAVKMVAVG